MSDTCVYDSCTGTRVPGAFASIVEAANALGVGGGTICLGPQAYGENVDLSIAAALTIQGVSATKTSIQSLHVQGSAPFTLKGVSILSIATIATSGLGTSTTVAGCAFGGASARALFSLSIEEGAANVRISASAFKRPGQLASSLLSITQGTLPLDILVDSSEFAGDGQMGQQTGIELNEHVTTGPLQLRIINSYFHGLTGAISLPGFSNMPSGQLSIVNNTLTDNTQAVFCAPAHAGSRIAVYNNLFVRNQTAVELGSNVGRDMGNNAFYGNGQNAAGAAYTTATDVTSDPQLDTLLVPPAPTPGSPCLGAGDGTKAPDHDFWERPRLGTVDLGAFQATRP